MATKEEVLKDLEDVARSFIDAEPEERDDLADQIRVIGNRFYASRKKEAAVVASTPEQPAEEPKPTRKRLQREAKELGIAGTSKMTVAELQVAIEQAAETDKEATDTDKE
jgi:hypothetical protein